MPPQQPNSRLAELLGQITDIAGDIPVAILTTEGLIEGPDLVEYLDSNGITRIVVVVGPAEPARAARQPPLRMD